MTPSAPKSTTELNISCRGRAGRLFDEHPLPSPPAAAAVIPSYLNVSEDSHGRAFRFWFLERSPKQVPFPVGFCLGTLRRRRRRHLGSWEGAWVMFDSGIWQKILVFRSNWKAVTMRRARFPRSQKLGRAVMDSSMQIGREILRKTRIFCQKYAQYWIGRLWRGCGQMLIL